MTIGYTPRVDAILELDQVLEILDHPLELRALILALADQAPAWLGWGADRLESLLPLPLPDAPDPEGLVPCDVLRDMLLLCGEDRSESVIQGWPEEVVGEVSYWCACVHLQASGNTVTVPPRPAILGGPGHAS